MATTLIIGFTTAASAAPILIRFALRNLGIDDCENTYSVVVSTITLLH